jgi:hypothetical protein
MAGFIQFCTALYKQNIPYSDFQRTELENTHAAAKNNVFSNKFMHGRTVI